MLRSSETIGKIATALAQAQRQLENPEKSSIGTYASQPTQEARSFRYASLAAGLEIIRKALGEHEIATVQSTSLDKELGLIRLNTVLAHSSGEWMASDWPVCSTNNIPNPQQLGAALTYARRYALFTIVGIAGEDDLDSPASAASQLVSPGASPPTPNKRPPVRPPIVIPADQSVLLRNRLLEELSPLTAADDLTLWALRRLPTRNTLQLVDAEAINAAYLAKFENIQSVASKKPELPRDQGNGREASPTFKVLVEPVDKRPPVLDRVPAFDIHLSKTLRRRNKAHLLYVATQPCLVCQRTPCDAHHLKFSQPRALGRKVSDEFTVPLCREHHSALHRHGNERVWWANAGLQPLQLAADLWAATVNGGAASLERVVSRII